MQPPMTISDGTLTTADGYNKIESTITFRNSCCNLSLSYRFLGCGYTTQEGLGLFLHRIHKEKNPRKQEDIKITLSEHRTPRW